MIRTAACLLAIAVLFAGCGGDGGGSSIVRPGIGASFTPSGTPAAAGLVRLRGAGTTGNVVTLEVAIGGPTESDDLYSFAFDLLLSKSTVARYIPGSASFGTALVPDSGQGTAMLVSQIDNRVVVGLTKTGGGSGSGNGVAAGEPVVVSLSLRVRTRGSTSVTIVGSPRGQRPDDFPAALDSTGSMVWSVDFDSAAARLSGI